MTYMLAMNANEFFRNNNLFANFWNHVIMIDNKSYIFQILTQTSKQLSK